MDEAKIRQELQISLRYHFQCVTYHLPDDPRNGGQNRPDTFVFDISTGKYVVIEAKKVDNDYRNKNGLFYFKKFPDRQRGYLDQFWSSAWICLGTTNPVEKTRKLFLVPWANLEDIEKRLDQPSISIGTMAEVFGEYELPWNKENVLLWDQPMRRKRMKSDFREAAREMSPAEKRKMMKGLTSDDYEEYFVNPKVQWVIPESHPISSRLTKAASPRVEEKAWPIRSLRHEI